MDRSHLKKYRERPSPSISANEHCGEKAMGNDGKMYISVANVKGICRWVIVDKSESKKVSRKPVRKVSKQASRKPVRKVSKKASRKVSRKPVRKVSKKASRKVSRKPVRKVSKKVSHKVSRKPVRKVSKKVSRKVSRKPVRKVSKKVSKKVSRKPIRKVSKNLKQKMMKSIREPPKRHYSTNSNDVYDLLGTGLRYIHDLEDEIKDLPANEIPYMKNIVQRKKELYREIVNYARKVDEFLESLKEDMKEQGRLFHTQKWHLEQLDNAKEGLLELKSEDVWYKPLFTPGLNLLMQKVENARESLPSIHKEVSSIRIAPKYYTDSETNERVPMIRTRK